MPAPSPGKTTSWHWNLAHSIVAMVSGRAEGICCCQSGLLLNSASATYWPYGLLNGAGFGPPGGSMWALTWARGEQEDKNMPGSQTEMSPVAVGFED